MKTTSASSVLVVGAALLCALPKMVAAMEDSADALLYGGPEELAEFSVAIHPEIPTTILVAGMRYVGTPPNQPFDITAFVSTNAGATWNVTPSVSEEPLDDFADPIVAWAKIGGTWTAVICFITDGWPRAVHVARSMDLGATWQGSEVFGDWPSDKSYVAAGPNSMFAAWVRVQVSPERIYLKRSTDQGATWPGEPTLIGETPQGTDKHHEPSIAFGPTGEVYLAWAVLGGNGTEKEFRLTKSMNDGASWSSSVLVSAVNGVKNVLFPDSIRRLSFPSMAVDRSAGPRSGWIYLAWTEFVAPGTEIYFTRSTDGGATFLPSALRINQATTNMQWSAWLACDPADGKLTAIWYDHRTHPDSAAAFTAVSTDGGTTWQEFQLGDQSFEPHSFGVNTFMGDYIGIDASQGYVVPAWADRRDGQHVVGYASPYLLDWSGTIALGQDFLIPPGYTLDVLPGTSIQVTPQADPRNVGRYTNLVELVARGSLRVNGEPTNRVGFESTGGVADWGGILFDVPAVVSAPPGYGYTHPSRILNADIEDATEGIAIRQTGAPSLDGLSFNNIQGNRHLVLDSSDVYVPYGGYWNLTAPTIVGIADSTRLGADIGGRNPRLLDVIVHGQLNTSGGAGSYVAFQPQALPPAQTNGDEWGGIFFDWMAAPSTMSEADVGYALTPISILGWWRSITLENSKVHRFRDRAIWMYGSGTTLSANTIYRDDGLPTLRELFGNVGIVVEKTLSGLVQGNTITLAGMYNKYGGSGIQILNSRTWCEGLSITPDTLRVVSNTIVGLGATSQADGKWSGFRADWGCANPPVWMFVTGNTLTDWNDAALTFSQSSDLRVKNNYTDASVVAVNFYRDGQPQGSSVRLRNNCLRIGDYTTEPIPPQAVARTDNAPFLGLGPNDAYNDLGRNVLWAKGPTKLVFENDPDVMDYLNARANYWRRVSVPLTDSTMIRPYIQWEDHGAADVQAMLGAALSAPPVSACVDEEGLAFRGPADGEFQDEAGAASRETPLETSLAVARSSPGAAEIRFTVGEELSREVRLEVFDVAGRRVGVLVQEAFPPGRYGVTWRGENGSGERVASGVYFVRLEGESVSLVRKVVLVH